MIAALRLRTREGLDQCIGIIYDSKQKHLFVNNRFQDIVQNIRGIFQRIAAAARNFGEFLDSLMTRTEDQPC